jgi:hypothetical protein
MAGGSGYGQAPEKRAGTHRVGRQSRQSHGGERERHYHRGRHGQRAARDSMKREARGERSDVNADRDSEAERQPRAPVEEVQRHLDGNGRAPEQRAHGDPGERS